MATAEKKLQYTYALGRRKTSTATVRLYEGKGITTINEKPLETVYPAKLDQQTIFSPLLALEKKDKFYFTAKTKGGGVKSQAEAIRHALSRALVKFDKEFRTTLKPLGYLTRDPRMVERKKTGLRKARKHEQYSKR